MSAAHTILQCGGRVLVLDKSPFCGGNSTKATSGINASGTSTQRALGIHDSPELFEKDTTVSAMDKARPELIHTLTHESAAAVEWLKKEPFCLDLSMVARLAAHSEPRTHRGKERFPGMAITYCLMEKLDEIAAAEPSRASVVNKARVLELIQRSDGVVEGVVFEKGGQTFKEYGPVILCTGGFGADFSSDSLLSQVMNDWDKLEAWSTTSRAASQSGGKKVPAPNLMSLPTTNGIHCSGDGIKLALKAGAGTYDLHFVQVHPTGLVDPEERNAKVKFLAAEALRGSGALILDRNGKRFCDELGKRDYVTGRMWIHGAPPYRLCLNSKAASLIMWHCEHYEGRGLMKRMGGADLAKLCNVSQKLLQKEFDVYNKAAENPGTDIFGKKFFTAAPVMANDTFYVAEITPVIHYCMGGVAANARSEVLTPSGTETIKGLYVSGEAQGGVHGVNRLGGSSLLDCVVFGRIAGRESVKYLLSNLLEHGGSGVNPQGVNVRLNPNDKSVTISWDNNSAKNNGEYSKVEDASTPEQDPNAAFYAQGVTDKEPKKGNDSKSTKPSPRLITSVEVAKHKTKDDCWVILHNKVFNITDFLDDHPGGAKAILLYGGKDASKEFDMLHKPDIVDKYAMDYYIGELAGSKL